MAPDAEGLGIQDLSECEKQLKEMSILQDEF